MEEQYQEIDLRELIEQLLKFWWLILSLAVIFAGASYFVTKYYVKPIYQSKTTLFIGKEAGALPEINLQDLTLGNKLVSDYRELIKTNLVLDGVIENLNLNTTVEELRKKISVSTVNDSRFIYVRVKDQDPVLAQSMANEVSAILKEAAEVIIGSQNMFIVDSAIKPKHPVSPRLGLNVAIAAVLGVMLAIFIAFLKMALSNTITTEQELERLLNIPVIGVIPKFKGENR